MTLCIVSVCLGVAICVTTVVFIVHYEQKRIDMETRLTFLERKVDSKYRPEDL